MFDNKAKIFGPEVEKNYQAILELQEVAEVVDYLEKHVDTPVGQEFFVPLDYQWGNTAFTIDAKRYHQWSILQDMKSGILRATLTERDKQFKNNFRRFENLYGAGLESPEDIWVKNKYNIALHSYASSTQPRVSFIERISRIFWIRQFRVYRKHMESSSIGKRLPYQWKQVGVTPLRRRPQLILVDVLTGLEAPLLSDQESTDK